MKPHKYIEVASMQIAYSCSPVPVRVSPTGRVREEATKTFDSGVSCVVCLCSRAGV